MSRSRKVVLWSCFALGFYLAAEALLPANRQPTARVAVALLHAYQATGSPVMKSCGVQCRYQPTCSHYAVDAISYYGTLDGLVRTAGRLWRCSPWGGSGYDPAVETHDSAYLDPQQETPEQKKAREAAEAAAKKIQEDLDRAWKQSGRDLAKGGAKCALASIGCLVVPLIGFVIGIILVIWVYNDAKARGDQNAVVWLLVVLFFHLAGFVIYLVVRPKGDLLPCPSCHKGRLPTLAKCPHCGADMATSKPPDPGAGPKPPQA